MRADEGPQGSGPCYIISKEPHIQTIPGIFNLGPGHGMGIQILNEVGILSTALGDVYIFDAIEVEPGDVNLIKIDTSIQINSQETCNHYLSFLKFHTFKGYVLLTGKVNRYENIEVIRCYYKISGETIWTKMFNEGNIAFNK